MYDENNIKTWLKEPWVGKDKQESLLRLFAGLGIIDKIKSYDIVIHQDLINVKQIKR